MAKILRSHHFLLNLQKQLFEIYEATDNSTGYGDARHPRLGRCRESRAGYPIAVTIDVADISAPIGVFGNFGELTIRFDTTGTSAPVRVLAQDLLADSATDISSEVNFANGQVTIPGATLRRIGLSAADPGDLSDPALVLSFRR